MYLPYLRGKQFELLALRELCALPLLGNRISPIIEPVKKDLKSIATAVRALKTNDVKIQLIVNPEHGDLKGDYTSLFSKIEELKQEGFDNIIPTYLIRSENDFRLFESTSVAFDYINTGYSLIHLNQIASATNLKTIANNSNLLFNTIHVNHLIALRRGYPIDSISFLSDPFVKQKRNVDYESYPDEFFSNDYYYYAGENFIAFADYLSIGTDYIEGGALPKAVVIHLTYKDQNSIDIRIKHFISDSNQDVSDTAGKFYEALGKLIAFVDHQQINSLAIIQFRDYYDRGAYPGLGVIKKLSIMHHIELIQSLI